MLKVTFRHWWQIALQKSLLRLADQILRRFSTRLYRTLIILHAILTQTGAATVERWVKQIMCPIKSKLSLCPVSPHMNLFCYEHSVTSNVGEIRLMEPRPQINTNKVDIACQGVSWNWRWESCQVSSRVTSYLSALSCLFTWRASISAGWDVNMRTVEQGRDSLLSQLSPIFTIIC